MQKCLWVMNNWRASVKWKGSVSWKSIKKSNKKSWKLGYITYNNPIRPGRLLPHPGPLLSPRPTPFPPADSFPPGPLLPPRPTPSHPAHSFPPSPLLSTQSTSSPPGPSCQTVRERDKTSIYILTGNSCMKQGGMCVKGKSCPNGFEVCGHSCGKGKKNKKKKCCCLIPTPLYLLISWVTNSRPKFWLNSQFSNFFEKIPVRILDALFRVFSFSREYFKGPDIFIHNRF